MLSIKIDNKTILPMRPDAPVKTFGSPDVPHGTQSVYYKAIKVYNSNGGNIPLPTFTKEELASHKAAFLATVEVLPLKDSEGNLINRSFTSQTPNQILEIDEETVKKEFYSNYPLPTVPEFDAEGKPVAQELKPRMKEGFGMMLGMPGAQTQKYADLAACKVALTEKAKDECAQRLLDHAVEQCLIVPELTQEFMDQFDAIQVEAK